MINGDSLLDDAAGESVTKREEKNKQRYAILQVHLPMAL